MDAPPETVDAYEEFWQCAEADAPAVAVAAAAGPDEVGAYDQYWDQADAG